MWVIALVAGLAVLVIFVLCIPLETTIAIDTSDKTLLRLRTSWFFGLIKKEIRRPKEKPPEKRKGVGEKRVSKRIPGIELMSKAVGAKGLLRQFKNLVVDVYGHLKTKELSGDFTIGLEDPAETGLLFAVIGPANALLNLHPEYNIRVQPSFDDENTFAGYLNGTLKVRPARLVGPAIKFVFSRDILKAGRSFITRKWRRKK